MGPATALMGAFAVLSLCTAILNLWIFAVRRRQAEHLWLAVASFGVFGSAWAIGSLYEAQTLADARSAQLATITASLPLVFGFLRFTSHFAKARVSRLERVGGFYTVAAAAAVNAFPELFFTGRALERHVPFFVQPHVEAEFTAAALALFGGFVVVFAALISIYWRARHRIESSGPLLGAVLWWLLCATNDTLVGMGAYPGPYLVVAGHAGFCVVFTGILIGRFVRSMDQVQSSADELHHLVEERTHELREKDLQIAHGARMATLGALAAGLAHEINNPVAFVSANVSHLAETWRTQEEVAFEEVLRETQEGVERIRGIVSQLLSLARRGEGSDTPVELERVVRDVLPIVRHEARDRAELQVQLEPVPAVLGDEGLLGQVVLNLVVNALHAIPPGRAERNRVRVSTRFEQGKVRLVVEDTGTGIPRRVLPHIFDPFFTTKEEGKGTGLGLAVTHQIVSRHRGRIGVESGERGTSFTVELPPLQEGRA